jgi:catechol 2,3-dioxygenase-like lactoylglutathione lyase family enzyme
MMCGPQGAVREELNMSQSPQVLGVLETALYVDDVARASAFYERVFGFRPMVSQGDRFCAMDVVGKQVLLLFKKRGTIEPLRMPGGVIPPHDGEGQLHFAFSISKESLSDWLARLAELGIPVESTMDWENGGVSVYFRDPDQHLVELVTPGCWPIW